MDVGIAAYVCKVMSEQLPYKPIGAKNSANSEAFLLVSSIKTGVSIPTDYFGVVLFREAEENNVSINNNMANDIVMPVIK